jgi:hypothetical protein
MNCVAVYPLGMVTTTVEPSFMVIVIVVGIPPELAGT